jgi:hypothetical protein
MVTHGFAAYEGPVKVPPESVETKHSVPPVKDPREIDFKVLAEMIREYSPENKVSQVSPTAIELNGTLVRIDPGKGQVYFGKTIAVYNNLHFILEMLRFEGILNCPLETLFTIGRKYRFKCSKH